MILLLGEPGLGKTRLVHEFRRLFMAWAGASSGRLPLWLEGRAASDASAWPYGLYQQLLCAWVGVVPDEDEELAHKALERAMKATFGRTADDERFEPPAQVMGLPAAKGSNELSRLGPEPLQRARFDAFRHLVSQLVAHGPDGGLPSRTSTGPTQRHCASPRSLPRRTSGGPLVVVVTRRPEPDPGTSALEAALMANRDLKVRKLELNPLAEAQERDLARALLGLEVPDQI